MTSSRYPIGEFVVPDSMTADDRALAIKEISEIPLLLRKAVDDLSRDQLDTQYRPEGWSLRQVVHHIPDSHLNGYTRCKIALTEDSPEIRTYEEAGWAELPDSFANIELSLRLLDALHRRWVHLMQLLDESAWCRTFRHPEAGELSIDVLAALYSWHGRHHIAHITSLREQKGW